MELRTCHAFRGIARLNMACKLVCIRRRQFIFRGQDRPGNAFQRMNHSEIRSVCTGTGGFVELILSVYSYACGKLHLFGFPERQGGSGTGIFHVCFLCRGESALLDLRVHRVTPGVPLFRVFRFRNDPFHQVNRGEHLTTAAGVHADAVHLPIKLVLVPNQRHRIQTGTQRCHCAGVTVRHDGDAVQHLDRNRLKARKVSGVQPGLHALQLFRGNIELGRLQILQLQIVYSRHVFQYRPLSAAHRDAASSFTLSKR